MNVHPALRLTPSNSPFFKSPTQRSPTKQKPNEEPGLHLKKVVGTTASSANAFDCLPSARQFAFTAGAAAVVATIDDQLNVSQQFFRANPSSSAFGRDSGNNNNNTNGGSNNGWPVTPTPNEARYRTVGSLKEQSNGASPLGASTRDWAETLSVGRSTTAKDRVKAATSVALSPNGRWLAVGETGYKPRILIFSTKDGSSETPIAAISEHAFGVHALRFSPDSRFLASLGTVNDGFLFIWSIDERTGSVNLHSSNKCTAMIHSLAWVGRSLVTAGLRFVKVWRPDDDSTLLELRATDSPKILLTPRNKADLRASDFGSSILSPRHRVLAGKNSLLGDMLEATFVAILPVNDSKAVVCAESGEICILDDEAKMQTLTVAAHVGARISAARLDDQGFLYVAGPDDCRATLSLADLEKQVMTPSKLTRRPSFARTRSTGPNGVAVIAATKIGDAVLEINSNRMIDLSKADPETLDGKAAQSLHLSAHEDGVVGVQAFHSPSVRNAAFVTFSANGTIRFWDDQGISIYGLTIPISTSPDMYGVTNELRALAKISNGTQLVTGDKYGTLSLVEVQTNRIMQQLRAHSAEILDVIAFDRGGVQFLASASRDRTVQLFVYTPAKLELLQTMDEHAAAVTSLLYSPSSDQLLSCSTDRTVVVRDAILRDSDDPASIAFGILRTITLKSAPTSMCLTSQEDTILISTVDRCISKYSTSSGQAGFSFKCSDAEGGEAAVMSKIVYAPSLNGNPTIAGVSSSDKSVRLYTEYGTLIARDWGHTEGITDIAIVESRQNSKQSPTSPQIVTVAADSTIFLWDSIVTHNRNNLQSADANETSSITTAAATTPLAPPLRKVLSFSEMSRLRREKALDENDPPSPNASSTVSTTPSVSQGPSPPKLRKKNSRMSVAQPPKLEPAFRSSTGFDTSRRRSLRNRSPSPPSPPRNNVSRRDLLRRPSLGMSLRSKSSETLLSTIAQAGGNGANANGNAGFGSLTASTESVCRTLRAYRKKLTTQPSTQQDQLSPDALRELEKELKLTARVVGERSQGKTTLDEAMITKLLDQASDRIVGLLDEKIKERVEHQTRQQTSGLGIGGDSDPALVISTVLESPQEVDERIAFERSETAPGKMETRKSSAARRSGGIGV